MPDSLLKWCVASSISATCIVTLVGCGSKPEATGPTQALPDTSPKEPFVIVSAERTPDEVTAALAKVRAQYELEYRRSGRFAARSMVEELSRTVPQLPEVPVGHSNQLASWAKVSLNGGGLGFDAIRFGNPLPGADLVFALALSAGDASRVKWWGLNRFSAPFDEATAHSYVRHNVVMSGLPLDEANTVTFTHTGGRTIFNGRDNVIGFVVDGEAPIDVYVKMMVFQAHNAPQIEKSSEAAAALGLTVPLPPTSAATPIDHAKVMGEEQGADAALTYLEEKLSDEDDWESWHQYLHMSHDHITKLIESDQTEQAATVALRTAPGVRRMRDESIKPTGLQCELIPVLLYNVACALAESGKAAEAVATLREAVDAGCLDVAMMRGDDSLVSLHDNAEFKRLIAELEDR